MGESEVPLECCLLHQVSHIDGVIALIDFCDVGKEFAIVMERMVQSKNLAQVMAQLGHRSLGEVTARIYFRQLIAAVVQCYQAGVLHRDIKVILHYNELYSSILFTGSLKLLFRCVTESQGENIVVDVNNEIVKLIDFGLGTYCQPSTFHEIVGNCELISYSISMNCTPRHYGC